VTTPAWLKEAAEKLVECPFPQHKR